MNTMNEEINIFKVLDFIRDNAKKYAKAKADRVYIEEFRKSKKALLYQESPAGTIAEKEAYAYAHKDYQELLDGLRVAVEQEEGLRWQIEAAKLKAEVWRSLEANKRVEAKIV